MKNKLSLLASIILAFGLVVTSPANANSQHQNSENYKYKKSNQVINQKVTHKKVVHIVQQSKSPHTGNNHHKIKQRIQYKPSLTFIKIDTTHIPLFTILFSQHNF